MTRLLPLLALLGALVGCASPVSTQARPDAYYSSASSDRTADSLFSGDAATLFTTVATRSFDVVENQNDINFRSSIPSGWFNPRTLAAVPSRPQLQDHREMFGSSVSTQRIRAVRSHLLRADQPWPSSLAQHSHDLSGLHRS